MSGSMTVVIRATWVRPTCSGFWSTCVRSAGSRRLIALVLYGSGLRLMECLTLRVKDLDFERCEIVIRQGKGAKDRVTTLGRTVADALRRHLTRVRRLHERDLASGHGSVALPDALVRKYPHAAASWVWQWVFPGESALS